MNPIGAISDNRLRIMRICSAITVICSFGFAFAYASRPAVLSGNLFGALAVHWFWAVIQGLLGFTIILAHFRGGYHLQLAHAFGWIVQIMYCLLWLMSAIYIGQGWFVWEGILALAVLHFVLSRLHWRDRAGKELAA